VPSDEVVQDETLLADDAMLYDCEVPSYEVVQDGTFWMMMQCCMIVRCHLMR
jgi:hypothetical protein